MIHNYNWNDDLQDVGKILYDVELTAVIRNVSLDTLKSIFLGFFFEIIFPHKTLRMLVSIAF